MNGGEPAHNPKPKIVVPEFLPDKHLDMLREKAEVIYDPDLYSDRETLLEAMSDATAVLVRNRTRIDRELLAAAKSLKVVGRLGVGLDNIDTDAAAEAGVSVFPAHGGNAVSVAEYVMGAMLILQRGVFSMTESMVAGEWPRQGYAFGNELMGRTLGLVGLGAIATEVAARARAFGMEVAAHDPYVPLDDQAWEQVRSLDLDQLLATAYVVSVHVPLSDVTRGLIDADAIASMKPGSMLINTARGGIVDQTAVAGALRSGALGGAALDVFSSEPLTGDSATAFEDTPNLILTPHLAGNTEESVDRVATMTVEKVLDRLGLSN